MADRIPLRDRIPAGLLDAIKLRLVPAKTVADMFGVHASYFSRVLKQIGVEKVVAPTVFRKQKASELSQFRQKFRWSQAEKVIKGEITVEKAAEEAKCTPRTIYRYVSLLRDPYPASNPDTTDTAAAITNITA